MQRQRLRFGLVGTGHWARITHAPALAATDGIDFAAVWGRDRAATSALAARYGASAHGDIDEFLDGVDAVSFAVPPDVQAAIAARAARAGRHLLLEKPIATTEAAAAELVQAVSAARVSSVVFFTHRFQADMRAWLDTVAREGPWAGGSAVWLGSAWEDSSPFNTSWRHDKGGLWDVAPHAVSLLWACLGPVVSVTADAGRADITHLVLHHTDGQTSTVTTTLSAPEAASGFDLFIWGVPGRSAAPTDITEPATPLRTALTELVSGVRTGRPHPCDVQFGRDVVHVIADAQRQVDSSRPSPAGSW